MISPSLQWVVVAVITLNGLFHLSKAEATCQKKWLVHSEHDNSKGEVPQKIKVSLTVGKTSTKSRETRESSELSSVTVEYEIPAGNVSVIYQKTLFCPGSVIKTKDHKKEDYPPHYDLQSCHTTGTAVDKRTAIADCDNNDGESEMLCAYNVFVGTRHNEEETPELKFGDDAAWVESVLSEKIGRSEETGFDWTNTYPGLFSRHQAETPEQMAKVPAGHSMQVYQTVATCGKFTVYTQHIQQVLKNKQNYTVCTEGRDEWRLIAKCDNTNSLESATCAYTQTTGLMNVNGLAVNSAEFDFSHINRLVDAFKPLDNKGVTEYDWSAMAWSQVDLSGAETSEIPEEVPGGHVLKIYQAVGLCGDYLIFTPKRKLELSNGKYEICDKPTNELVTIYEFDNDKGLTETTGGYSYKVGVFNTREALPGSVLDEGASPLLETIFKNKMANSAVDGFTWSNTSVFRGKRFISTTASVPSGRRFYVRQLMGKCGDYIVYTDVIQLQLVWPGNLEKASSFEGAPIEMWSTIFRYDNAQSARDVTHAYSYKVGTVNKSSKQNSEVYAGDVEAIFQSKLSHSKVADDFSWSQAAPNFFMPVQDSQGSAHIPSGNRIVVQQLIGISGEYIVFTNVLRSKLESAQTTAV